MEYAFNALGELTSTTGAGDATYSNAYGHDLNGRVDVIVQLGSTSKIVDIDYYADGRMESIDRYEDSIATTNLVATSDFVFDAMGRLDTLSHEDQYNAVIADYDFDYDPLSRITAIASVDGLAGYDYDNTNQLFSVNYTPGHPLANDDESYAFDENGNRVAPEIETGRSNRLLENADTSFGYDQEGSLTEATIKADGTYVELTWDHRGRMIAMAVYSDSEQTQLLSNFEYTYDIFNRRIAKELDLDGDTVIDTTERFIYEDTLSALCSTVPCSLSTVPSPSHIALVFDDDSLTHRYLHGPVIDMVLSDETFNPATEAFEKIYWALSDHQGTIRDVVSFNAATDTTFLEQHLIIDTFGNIKEEAVPVIRAVFTGREYDPESGLYYYRARYYDSVSGRFISQDPIGFAGGDGNLYRYVENNTLNAVDPWGLWPWSWTRRGSTSGFTYYESSNGEVWVDGETYDSLDEYLRPRRLKEAKQIVNSLPRSPRPTVENELDPCRRPPAANPELDFWKHWEKVAAENRANAEQHAWDMAEEAGWWALGGVAGKAAKGARGAGMAVRAAENLRKLGLEGVDLAGKSYNAGRKLLEKAGFEFIEVTKTGRKVFKHPKTCTEVSYDSGKALVGDQKIHWHIKGKSGQSYDRSGNIVDAGEDAAHIPAH